jgi:hypothetical protein
LLYGIHTKAAHMTTSGDDPMTRKTGTLSLPASAARAEQRRKALARWDEEGGAGPDGPQEGWKPAAAPREHALAPDAPTTEGDPA